uniref:Uncharacterized protein n=1 Tax=Clytia hemisphaerica TaxID=252671 RepID=A0A7M5V0M5_9CNID
MALSELATVLRLHPNFSVGDTFKVLLNALRDLDSETWSQFFFLPILSSELVTEYLGENGFEHVPDIGKFNYFLQNIFKLLLDHEFKSSERT